MLGSAGNTKLFWLIVGADSNATFPLVQSGSLLPPVDLHNAVSRLRETDRKKAHSVTTPDQRYALCLKSWKSVLSIVPYKLTIHQIQQFLCKNVGLINENSLFRKRRYLKRSSISKVNYGRL